jgi:hypothetical protein
MATIDPSIPLGVKPVQIESPMNLLMQYGQLQGMQQQNALAQMKMQELTRAREDENALRAGLSAPGADPYKVLLGRGKVTEANAFQKGQREAEKAKLEEEKDRLGMVSQKLTLGAQILSTAKDQASYDAARATAQASGLDISRMPPQFDPTFVQTKLQESMTLKDQAEQRWKELDFGLRREQFGETQRHNTTSEGLTERGQNLTDTRAREEMAQRAQQHRETLSKPFEVSGPDGTPQLVQQDKAGNVVPVQGFTPKGNSKPLSQAALKQLSEARDNANTLDRLFSEFKPEYAEKGVLGLGAEASLAAKSVLGSDKDTVNWWKNYRKQAELVERHSLFGAALTPTEQTSWRSADIGPGMDADVVKRNLQTRAALTKKVLETTRQDLIDAGQSEQRVNAIAGRGPAAAAPAPAAAPTTVLQVRTAEDYAKVPSGATYTTPDGKTRRKP